MSNTSTIWRTLREFGAAVGFPENGDPVLILASLIRVALGFVGIILVIMIIYSGFLFLFSAGKSENLEAAKKTFFNAIIGVIIIFLSYGIVDFVIKTLSAATGSPAL